MHSFIDDLDVIPEERRPDEDVDWEDLEEDYDEDTLYIIV